MQKELPCRENRYVLFRIGFATTSIRGGGAAAAAAAVSAMVFGAVLTVPLSACLCSRVEWMSAVKATPFYFL